MSHRRIAVFLLPLFVSASACFAAGESEFLIGRHAVWKYLASEEKPPEAWNQPVFDDSSWKSGRAGFGYGDDDDRTVLDDMQGKYTSVYIRTAFDWQELAPGEQLYLYVNFDDGFIAHLNGTQVAAAAVTRTDGGWKVSLHEAEGHEEFAIGDARQLLKPGRNVLAIEGHNANLDSSDFSLDPVLSRRKLKNLIGVGGYLADIAEFERRLLDQSSYLSLYAQAAERNSIRSFGVRVALEPFFPTGRGVDSPFPAPEPHRAGDWGARVVKEQQRQ